MQTIAQLTEDSADRKEVFLRKLIATNCIRKFNKRKKNLKHKNSLLTPSPAKQRTKDTI
jgi:hypothetical protein